MIKTYVSAPAVLVMALLALFSFLRLVNIVGCMTAVAVIVELFVMGIAPVACAAAYFIMLATQREIRFAVVVKLRLFPVFGCVTGPALLSVAATMFIIIVMTCDTFRVQLFLIKITAVADVAFYPAMLSFQRILGVAAVIKASMVPGLF